METHVRPARLDDLETLVGFVSAVAEESEGRTLDPVIVRQGLREALADPHNVAAYHIAERGGLPVGCLMVTKEWSDWTAGWYWWIQSVYVVPAARGTGVFDTMYAWLKAAAREAGVKSLRLYVDGDNRRGIQSYERLGMARTRYLIYTDDLDG